MAELVDATDLKSVGTLLPCRFDSGFPHHYQINPLETKGFLMPKMLIYRWDTRVGHQSGTPSIQNRVKNYPHFEVDLRRLDKIWINEFSAKLLLWFHRSF